MYLCIPPASHSSLAFKCALNTHIRIVDGRGVRRWRVNTARWMIGEPTLCSTCHHYPLLPTPLTPLLPPSVHSPLLTALKSSVAKYTRIYPLYAFHSRSLPTVLSGCQCLPLHKRPQGYLLVGNVNEYCLDKRKVKLWRGVGPAAHRHSAKDNPRPRSCCLTVLSRFSTLTCLAPPPKVTPRRIEAESS